MHIPRWLVLGAGIVGVVCIATIGVLFFFRGNIPLQSALANPFIPPNTRVRLTPSPTPSSTPTPSPTPSPSPSPKPLTFAEMNAKYGPCVNLPVLMYHHVEDMETAKAEGHGSLTTDPANFRAKMQELRDKGYTVISASQLIAFFDEGSALPAKPAMVTFDDGYQDFADFAIPILREFSYPATLFVPTGLMENPGYLSWNRIAEMSGQNILMANHTWSHHSVLASPEVDKREIATADQQLSEKGLNAPKVFAYPYGSTNAFAQRYLQELGYKLAFTTTSGTIECKQQRFALPRVRRISSSI